jgi:hypothetical protein
MEKRQDDRDAKKSLDEATDNPWEANKTGGSEQAAELQVGEDRERENLSRFEPDPLAEKSYPDPLQGSVVPSDAKEKDSDSEP